MRNLPCLTELRWWKERCSWTLEKATETWNLDTVLIIILIIQLCGGGHSTEHVQCERSSQDDVSIQPSLFITNTGSPYFFLVNHSLCKSFSGTVVTSWAAEHTYYCSSLLMSNCFGALCVQLPLCHPVFPSLWGSQGHIMNIHFSFPMWHRTWRVCLSASASHRISSSSFHFAENGRAPFLGRN